MGREEFPPPPVHAPIPAWQRPESKAGINGTGDASHQE